MTEPRSGTLARLVQHLPGLEELDRNIYRSVAFGFPLLTLVIITGAVWAQYVWQRWWSWDPKETASLVTWLIYGAYLHGRRQRNWHGTTSAAFAVFGFLAVLFTYAGVNLLDSIHSYGLPTSLGGQRQLGGFTGVGAPEAALTRAVYLAFAAGFCIALWALVSKREVGYRVAVVATGLGMLALTVVLVIRTLEAGRLTFTSGYDFSLWFVWGIGLCALVAGLGKQPVALVGALPLALLVAMYGYLWYPHKGHTPLPPALQNKLWLHIHVAIAIFAYGALALAAGWGVLYWLKSASTRRLDRAPELVETVE